MLEASTIKIIMEEIRKRPRVYQWTQNNCYYSCYIYTQASIQILYIYIYIYIYAHPEERFICGICSYDNIEGDIFHLGQSF